VAVEKRLQVLHIHGKAICCNNSWLDILQADKIHGWKVGMIYQVIERVGGVKISKTAALGSPVFSPKRESFCCLTVSQTSPNGQDLQGYMCIYI
jgi:hypothetical protein